MTKSFAAGNRPYFQQKVNYVIDITLDDNRHALNGSIKIEYINNSPDTLYEIWMHVWPNAYKNAETPLAKQQLEHRKTDLYFAKDDDRGFMDQLSFKQDENPVSLEYKAVDYGVIKLVQPILPGATTIFSTPFHVKIPSARFSRMGHDGQAYYISQWYPKPAVYDNEGWHPMSYLDQGEFYSEFGNYEVRITLPANYIVASTGECQDKDEIAWMMLQNREYVNPDPHVWKSMFPKSESKTKTLIYKQDNVHDFAWFADKRFVVQRGSVVLPNSSRRIDTWAFSLPQSQGLWRNAVQYVNQAVYDYSLWNGDYIYNSCAVVQGALAVSDGMEYPMVALVSSSDTLSLQTTVVHEVGHNWFYGMLGSNERQNPWMDEGLNSLNEMRSMQKCYPVLKENNVNDLTLIGSRLSRLTGVDRFTYKDSWQVEYDYMNATRSDQAIDLPAEEFTWANYGVIAYRKTAIVFNYLRHYLGDETFDRCMKKYFDKWKLKHPMPNDLKTIFESETGKDMKWFFDDILTGSRLFDYKIKSVKKSSDGYSVKLCNNGGIAAPTWLHGLKNDSVIFSVAVEGFTGEKEIESSCKECSSFYIDYYRFSPDVNRNNNNISASGILRKSDPFSIGLFPKFSPANARRLCVFPSVGWNEYNKWMAGLTFYNKTIPLKKFEYAVSALYGFGDKEPAAIASADYNIYPAWKIIDNIDIGVRGKRFAFDDADIRTGKESFEEVKLHYLRCEPLLSFKFRNKDVHSFAKSVLTFSFVNVLEENLTVIRRVDSENYNITGVEEENRNVFRVAFNHENNKVVDPYGLALNAEIHSDYQKYFLSAGYKFSYTKPHRGVTVRAFAGVMNRSSEGIAFPFHMHSWSGRDDAWYDEMYLGRSRTYGFLSHQMTLHDGGFKSYLPYASSAEWLTSLNVDVDLPGTLPVSFFINAGTFKNAEDILSIYDVKGNIIYEGGLRVKTFLGSFYFPILRSDDIKAYQSGDFGIDEITFKERIRFEIYFDKINPFYLRNTIF